MSKKTFRRAPVAHAVVITLAAAGLAGHAHAQRAFSAAWMAQKNVVQGTAAATGYLPNGTRAALLSSPQAQQQQANGQLQHSLDNLNLAARAIAAQQAVQAAARQAALSEPGSVPDGLAEGGLKIDTNSLTAGWLNANAPTQSSVDGRTNVAIEQTADKAILNWETFHVGKKTTVEFKQQADWAVLNRVNDPQARPSVIQGQIRGDGTVLIVNRNGVVFSGTSQTDTRNLVAAAARIGDDQFKANGIYSAQQSGAYTPSFTDAGGAVKVEAGAQIATRAPASVTQGGGYALLLGADVGNAGTITTPHGQAQLAAGDFFVVRPGQGTAANQTSTTRGNEVAPGFNADSTAGHAVNTGLLQAPEGDVTLAGRQVRQDGVALATTTVDTRGTIHLLNSASDTSGSVTIGQGALNAILLDDQKGRTALDSQRDALIASSAQQDLARRTSVAGVFDNLSRLDDRLDQSRVEVVSGGDVTFSDGSTTLATGGQLAVSTAAAGRTTVAEGARLDVSGAVGVQVVMAANNVQVNIQGNEQRDAPLNRDTTRLNSTNVWIDRRQLLRVAAGVGGYDKERWYTAGGLLEVGGYLGLQGHTIGEWSAQGGSISVTGGELVSRAGSNINLSGGSLDVATGVMHQSWLKGADGRLYAVTSAPGDIAYTGLYRGFEDAHTRWGDSATAYFYNPLIGPGTRLENGYTVGRDAGRLVVATRTAEIDGDVTANVFQGARQIGKPDSGLDGYVQSHNAAPLAGQLIVGSYTTVSNSDAKLGPVGIFHNIAAVADRIVFGTPGADAAGDVQQPDGTLYLDSDRINGFGLGSILVAGQDGVSVEGALAVAPGGSIALHAPMVTVEAGLTARGGSIALGNVLTTVAESGITNDSLMLARSANPTGVQISDGATLDTRGLWSNLLLDPQDGHLLPYIDGGSVDVRSSGGVTLAAGTRIDVSSGAALRADGSLSGGRGGDATLVAGYATNPDDKLIDAPLQLDGEVRGWGVAGGGTLTVGSGVAVGIGQGLAGAGGMLRAGETTQVNLQLAQDLALHAGDTIPADFAVTVHALAPGQTLVNATTPVVSSATPLAVAADWVVPQGLYVVSTAGAYFFGGSAVPAGTALSSFFGPLPAGYTIPADAFPAGVPIAPTTVRYATGTVATGDLLIPAGAILAAGSTVVQALSVTAPTVLASDLFQRGFSHYAVQGRDGLVVAQDSSLDVSMPVLRIAPGQALTAVTGAAPADTLSLWTPPLQMEDRVHATLTQRGGASLSLSAGASLALDHAPLVIGHGAVVSVDPGQAIDLRADGQLTVEGRLNAWGGTISLASLPANTLGLVSGPAGSSGTSVWIGDDAVLDAAGRAHVALDTQGRAYGAAQAGGAITVGLSDAYVIVRPGAVLDASGSRADVDAAAGTAAGTAAHPLTLAGNGGSIDLHSYSGIVLDGTLRARAGGAGAVGGELGLYLQSRLYDGALEPVDAGVDQLSTVRLVQNAGASGLRADLAPGQADAALVFGQAALGVNQVRAGGFDALTLAARDRILFDGDIDLSLGRSLNLRNGVLTVSDSTPDAHVRIAAPYIRLDGGAWTPLPLTGSSMFAPGLFTVGGGQAPAGHSSLTLEADLIDLHGLVLSGTDGVRGMGTIDGSFRTSPAVSLDGFADILLKSGGDLRLDGGLNAAGNIEVSAAQVYPISGAYAALIAGNRQEGIAPDSTLRIRSSTGSTPAVPYSVFGQLVLAAGTVDQGGVVRAPLGNISINTLGGTLGTDWLNNVLALGNPTRQTLSQTDPVVILRDGSLTSVSAAGLEMPFGGTVDGVNYDRLATSGRYTTRYNLADTHVSRGDTTGSKSADLDVLATGIAIGAARLVGEPGAVLDLSGGGTLHGEGFVSGRGGSVNVLATPLANANPALASASRPGNAVYAILPGYASAYAPLILDKGAGDPAVGAQIEIGAGVPGLAAGTYTLMPASFALMPGAYRVELGAQLSPNGLTAAGAVAQPGGSWVTTAMQGIAGTAQRNALPTQVLVTPGNVVRSLAQYNETSLSQFLLAQAEQFGTVRSRLPDDGKILELQLVGSDRFNSPLDFAGSARFAGVGAGYDGLMVVDGGGGTIEIVSQAALPATPTPGVSSPILIADGALNAFTASTLMVGDAWRYFDGSSTLGDGARIYFGSGQRHGSVLLREGATLRAGQVFLVSETLGVESGASIDTRGFSGRVIDSSLGYVYANGLKASPNGYEPAVLLVANGRLDLLPSVGAGRMTVADGASLLTQGTIGFAAPGALALGDVNMGARYLTVSQDQISVGTAESIAAAEAAGVQAQGWHLTQAVLDRLLKPAAGAGLPALERLSLTAGGGFNFYGAVTLDTGDAPVQMVFNTPAFYGWGGSGDQVRIATGNFVWNGVASGAGTVDNPFVSAAPAPVQPGGPGTGSGQLLIDADTVLLGYDAASPPQRQTALDRLALGFAGVTLQARQRVTANNAGTLNVAGTQAADGSRTGGDLLITTPLLTGEAGSSMQYIAGGQLRVAAPAGAALVDTAAVQALGASVTLDAQAIRLDTAVALPSGKLTLRADGDIALGGSARIDMAGRKIDFFDVSKYSWGGDVSLTSDGGSITQAAGGSIDVSAANHNAGLLLVHAATGSVDFSGALKAAGGGGAFQDGRFDLSVGRIGDDAFTQLNQQLDDGAFFGARDFVVKTGDLKVDGRVRAHAVSIETDGGSLNIAGTIDASGPRVGSISLSARDDLTLAGSAVLDTHGSVLVTDSQGRAIDASNAAQVVLTSSQGTVRLAGGASIDLRSADDVARGRFIVNAPRTDETGGDIRIDASGPLRIRGAESVAVNGFWRYDATGPGGTAGTVRQDNGDADGNPVGADGVVGLAQIDSRSRAFIDAAWQNAGLRGRMAGLTAYGDAFHLRPGVEIYATGDLDTVGDLDLSGYRYGPGADPARRGSGEPGVLTLRAGGELHVNGSINDGFGLPPASPDNHVVQNLLSSVYLDTDYLVPSTGLTLGTSTQLPYDGSLDFDLSLPSGTRLYLSDDTPLPIDVVLVNVGVFGRNAIAEDRILAADIVLPDGTRIPAGTNTSTLTPLLGDSLRLPPGTVLKAGMNAIQADFFSGTTIAATNWTAGANLAVLNSYTLTAPVQVPAGKTLPAGMYVSSATVPGGEHAIWAIAPMLDAGSRSWSMRLVGGADVAAADSRAVRGPNAGGITLNDPFTVNQDGRGFGVATPGVSVVRTGTGSLELYAAGDYVQQTPFGVYTAGTWLAGTGPDSPWNAPRELQADGTALGGNLGDRDGYLATLADRRMWLVGGGGDFTLKAGRNIRGSQELSSEMVGSWLLRQGGAELGQATAWGINFGSYVFDGQVYEGYGNLGLAAFSGLGALGGGTVAVRAGGDIGVDGTGTDLSAHQGNIVVAVGGSGRVIDGAVVQSGGGDLSVDAGGRIYGGLYANLRGDTSVRAASVGAMRLQDYNVSMSQDPRASSPTIAYSASSRAGANFAPGDGRISLESLGDLVLGAVIDPGRAEQRIETSAALADGTQGNAVSWFSLWTDKTAVQLFSAGGNLSPLGTSDSTTTLFLPSVLQAVAPGGSIYFAGRIQGGDYLMPSPIGQLELLAGDRVSGVSANNASNGGSPIGLLGTSASTLATPLHPAWRLAASGSFDGEFLASNYWRGVSGTGSDIVSFDSVYNTTYNAYNGLFVGSGGTPFMFGPNTLSDDSMAGQGGVSHIYATGGDIQNAQIGEVRQVGNAFEGTLTSFYLASKPVRMLAGGDIVNSGGLIAHGDANDVSMVAAGGDIFFTGAARGFSVMGPGTLEVSAGGDINLGNQASFTSLGPVSALDSRPGAGIVVQAGLGAGKPGQGASDFDGFAKLYLDPARLSDPAAALADQPGKVARTYQAELGTWLEQRYGFKGTPEQARGYFAGLASEQQRIFLRQVFYAELTAAGREYNDPDSQRAGSYLRGRQAIAALFPAQDAEGRPVQRAGSITLYQGTASNAGVRTVAGGSIQTLTPGGGTVVGVEGVVPATADTVTPAGLLTQGAGDIQMYSQDSILLGLSRVMTTFGGDIIAWSASGDINAGRGSKTTLVYTPPKREYDDIGNVKLSPNVPSSGAGIATLAPIPEVPPGDVDLIAPLGTIDAGEAGIRVSGNVNLAALQVVNAANIQVKGQATGLPLVASVNVGALANASAVASQAVGAAQDVVQRERAAQRQSLPSVFTVRVLGFGTERPSESLTRPEPAGADARGDYDMNSPVQVLGRGPLGDAQKTRLTPQERRFLTE